jgi:NADH-quinone oxidoreductase subunit F
MVAYIYIRGEFYHVQLVLEAELAKARAAGYVGKNIMGTGFDCEIHIHRGAGAYEAGEETALIESLEGKRAQPRIKPPFPAVEGLWGCPTAVNNVETLCNVPFIIEHGVEWFTKIGPEKNSGPKLFCISGHVQKPGTYEASMDVSFRDLIYDPKYAGGIRGGHKLKAVIPGGSSVPVLLPDQLDIPASFDGLVKAGSMLGSAGAIVMDETTCMVWAAENLLYFYKHESCGKCTPCREGGDWLHRLLGKIERGEGEMRDLDLLLSVANNIMGKTLCAFGDAEATPVLSTISRFRDEYEAHIREGRCTVPAPWRAGTRVMAAH